MTDPKSKYDLFPIDGTSCTEWGVPDWRNESYYGDVSKWSKHRWRWEFYRRREDFRKYFDQMVEKTYHDQLNISSIEGVEDFELLYNGRAPNEPGFVVGVKLEDMDRFGYLAIPNPRIGHQPEEVIKPIKTRDEVWFQADSPPEESGDSHIEVTCHMEHVSGPREEDRLSLGTTILCQPPVIAGQSEVAVTFDLNEPILAQIKRAQKILEDHQRKKHGKLLRKSDQKTLWLGYLRVLDAKEAGATWQEMVDVLYADGTLGPRKAPEGGYEAPPPQAARDKWKSANALRFDF